MTEFTESEAKEQEDLWEKEMLQIYADAEAIGYEASGFRGLVADYGPLRAAKMLINMDDPSDGFTELWKLDRLDISVEARALKPDFLDVFSTSERLICRKRLAAYDWNKNPSWSPPA